MRQPMTAVFLRFLDVSVNAIVRQVVDRCFSVRVCHFHHRLPYGRCLYVGYPCLKIYKNEGLNQSINRTKQFAILNIFIPQKYGCVIYFDSIKTDQKILFYS